MRLWIAKNSEIPVREQIVAQITLAVASGDLAVGAKIPSTAEVARRFKIHANTVARAYQELAELGWLEFRTGSGFFVRNPDAGPEGSIEKLVGRFLREARAYGFSAEEVHACVAKFVSNRRPERILLLEDDESLRDILITEIRAALGVRVDGIPTAHFDESSFDERAIVAALFDERPKLGVETECFFLNARSVAEALSSENRPADADLIAVASGWDKFLVIARTMLIAARIDSDSLIVRSTSDEGWRHGLDAATLIICDALTATNFHNDSRIREFRLISDDSLAELQNSIRP